MPAATVTKTEYGFSVTGGTAATTINADKLWVKRLAFAGSAIDKLATLTSDPYPGAAISCGKFKVADGTSGDLDVATNSIYFGDRGVPFNNLTVTMDSTTSILYVYLTR